MNQDERALPAGLFTGLARSGPIPFYFQVSQRLEHATLGGDLPAGSRLEKEGALAERLGLSRPAPGSPRSSRST